MKFCDCGAGVELATVTLLDQDPGTVRYLNLKLYQLLDG
jgi:hypothetical protein